MFSGPANATILVLHSEQVPWDQEGNEDVVYGAKIQGQKEINSGNPAQQCLGQESSQWKRGVPLGYEKGPSLVLTDVRNSYQQTLLLHVLPKPALDWQAVFSDSHGEVYTVAFIQAVSLAGGGRLSYTIGDKQIGAQAGCVVVFCSSFFPP